MMTIHQAVLMGLKEEVKNMINKNPFLLLEKDHRGHSPRECAIINEEYEILEFLEQAEIKYQILSEMSQEFII